MSLATRCPACQTAFRVVQDQLKVSQGWVRCGHCHEVFDAAQSVFAMPEADEIQPKASAPVEVSFVDIEIDGTVVAPMPSAAPSASAALSAPAPASTAVRSQTPAVPSKPDKKEAEPQDPSSDEVVDADGTPTPLFTLARPSQFLDEDSDSRAFRKRPSFVPPPPQARWWRALLGFFLILSLSALCAAQWIWHERDELAMRWPQTRPWLETACARWDCQILPPRRPQDLEIISTALVLSASGHDTVDFDIQIQNHADFPVAWPAIELTLTQASDSIVSRKIFQAHELGAVGAAMPARSTQKLHARLKIDQVESLGYTVDYFYP